jgi:uncharacterized protein YabN with tetrapyrrole methylase and pyrophosphatase domain
MSALQKAYRLQEMATCSGLDWPEASQVWSVINDELAEAKSAFDDPSVLAKRLALRTHRNGRDCLDSQAFELCLQNCLGKLLFAVVDICRKLDIDPDLALETVNEDFESSFSYVRRKTTEKGYLMGLEDKKNLNLLWKESQRMATLEKKISAFPAIANEQEDLSEIDNSSKESPVIS